jgi:Bacterial type II/III secretion system short domain
MRSRTTLTAAMLALIGGPISHSAAADPAPSKAATRPPTAAEPPKPQTEPQKPQRTIYQVQHGDAAAIASVVSKLFKNEVDVIAAPTGNAILVGGRQAAVDEALQMIEILDRAPRSVEVEITLAELPRKDGAELTPAELAKAADLAKAGGGQRITLVAVEGQPVTSTTGGNKPVVSGMAGGGFNPADGGRGGGGPVRRTIAYQSVGTTIQMTARIGEKDSVLLDLTLQDSKVRPPDAADDTGATSIDNVSLATRLNIPAGKAVVARTVRTEGKAGATVAVVVVTAKVVGAEVASRTK